MNFSSSFFFAFMLLFVQATASGQPNVVFIIVDDLNDLPYQPDGKPMVPTPNIDRLKNKGITFTNAHTNNPLCAPSRASMLFGLYPQTTSLYWFENWRDNGVLSKCVSLQENLRNGGFKVYGAGKIYHGAQRKLFDEYGYDGDFGPWPWDGREVTNRGYQLPHSSQQYLLEGPDSDIDYQWEHTFGPLSNIPKYSADTDNSIPGYRGWIMGKQPWHYTNDEERDLLADEQNALWAKEIINRDHSTPYALFVGLVRTHTPLYAPKQYFDRFPLDAIELPKVHPNDLDDVTEALGNETLYGFRRYKMLARHKDKDLLRQWLQAYMACVSFIDDQVGTILDAIENSPNQEQTIVILTSDHGFHIGEKEFLYKGSLWEPSTRIPLIIAGVPGGPVGKTCDHPVSLIDVYPTFNDLCKLNKNPNKDGNGYALEGHSLLPLIQDPENGAWMGPEVAITSIPGKNHMQHQVYDGTLFPHFSIRSKRYRYSLTSDGGEELYDHQTDPFEWENLANDRDHHVIKESLKTQLMELRDGKRWVSLMSLASWDYATEKVLAQRQGRSLNLTAKETFAVATVKKYEHFELEFDAKSSLGSGFGIAYGSHTGFVITTPLVGSSEALHSKFKVDQWNRYRIRVHHHRHQLWINNRLVSDSLKEGELAGKGSIKIHNDKGMGIINILNARVRRL